jgi:hypothetical protein
MTLSHHLLAQTEADQSLTAIEGSQEDDEGNAVTVDEQNGAEEPEALSGKEPAVEVHDIYDEDEDYMPEDEVNRVSRLVLMCRCISSHLYVAPPLNRKTKSALYYLRGRGCCCSVIPG